MDYYEQIYDRGLSHTSHPHEPEPAPTVQLQTTGGAISHNEIYFSTYYTLRRELPFWRKLSLFWQMWKVVG